MYKLLLEFEYCNIDLYPFMNMRSPIVLLAPLSGPYEITKGLDVAGIVKFAPVIKMEFEFDVCMNGSRQFSSLFFPHNTISNNPSKFISSK